MRDCGLSVRVPRFGRQDTALRFRRSGEIGF